MEWDEIQVKIEPDLHLQHLRNSVKTSGSELSPESEFGDKMVPKESEVQMEPDELVNLPPPLPLQHFRSGGIAGTSAESSSELKTPKKEVDEIPKYLEIMSDSESNCEEIEEKYTPLDPVLFCKPVLLSTKKTKCAIIFKCSKCLLEFQTNTLLRKHIKAKKCKFICSICQQRFKSKSQLYLHELYTHSIKKEKPEEFNHEIPVAAQVSSSVVKEKQCFKCDLSFTTDIRLQNHENSAHPVKKEFKCSTCDLKFSSENIQMIHEKFTHPRKLDSDVINTSLPLNLIPQDSLSANNKKNFIRQRASSANSFYLHKTMHQGNFQCPNCPSSFINRKGLHIHYSFVHGEAHDSWGDNKKPFNCSKCSETFVKVSKIISHAKWHGDDYPCKICMGVFASKYYLTTHRRVAHPGCPEPIDKALYKCRICPQLLTTMKEVKEHEKLHMNWPCEFCPAVFENQQARAIHIQNGHPEQKPFKCSKCELSFVTHRHRKNHMKEHNETIRFVIKCYKCDITFPTLFEQARHEEEFHSQPVAQIKWQLKPSKKNLSFRRNFKLNPGRTRCHLCSQVFLSQNSLIIHKINMHPEKNKQITKGKQKRSDLVEESSSSGGDLTSLLSVDSAEPILKSVGRINHEEVFVVPVDIKEEFIFEQSEPEDSILGF